MATASQYPDAGRLDVDPQSVSVPLHLESPLRTFWRSWLEERETRIDARRHGIERELRLGGIAPPSRPAAERCIRFTEQRL